MSRPHCKRPEILIDQEKMTILDSIQVQYNSVLTVLTIKRRKCVKNTTNTDAFIEIRIKS